MLSVSSRRLWFFRRGNLILSILEDGTERSDGRRRSKCQQTLAGVFQPRCTIAVGQLCHTGTGFVTLFGFFAACQEIADNGSSLFPNRAALSSRAFGYRAANAAEAVGDHAGDAQCHCLPQILYRLYALWRWIVEWMKRGMQERGTELAKMFEEAQGTGINQ